ncbi:MAG: hypothetical protein GX250_04440 [Clostridiales bacterium]|nr:hypothetical protein [Clostridiales bacterium]
MGIEENILSIVQGLIQGVDITTGEIFDKKILYKNEHISQAIIKLALSTQQNLLYKGKKDSVNIKNRNTKTIFRELKKWRLNKAIEINLPAYCVFSDKELWSIAEGDAETKEDLLLIKGVNNLKYHKYGDDLFQIIKEHIDNRDFASGTKRLHKNPSEPFLENAARPKPVVEDRPKTVNKPVESPDRSHKQPEQSCENCMLYRSAECFGQKGNLLCEFYKPAPTISKEEIANWPEFGDATYFRMGWRR